MKKYTHPYFITFFFCLIIGIACKADKVRETSVQILETPEVINSQIKINKINFYFENSGSMNGYLNGVNFRQSIRRILHRIEGNNLQSYFVNTKEYKVDKIVDKISKPSSIKTPGIENSDHKFIFTNAIKNSSNNNLSIVITDGIYSMKDGNIADVEVDIQDAFENALKANEIETVVLKMTSDFNGTYYSESCKPGHKAIKINQIRPYYIFLFSNKQVINKALKEIVVIDDLNGHEDQARFMITKDLSINYTVLTQGEEQQGEFKQVDRRTPIVREIGDAKKSSKRGGFLKDNYLQFGIAVDYSKTSIPESYLLNQSNYSILDNTGYSIDEIKKIVDLDKTSKSYRLIDAQNKKGKLNYTHILVVKAKEKIYGDLSLSLNINFPEWIRDTGTNNDCSIKNDTNTTFAFDRLMIGVSKAYKKVGKKDNFFKINIKIKAD